ncbi:hypothetical protein X975_04124, partial [Stegodyphus mimosarum]
MCHQKLQAGDMRWYSLVKNQVCSDEARGSKEKDRAGSTHESRSDSFHDPVRYGSVSCSINHFQMPCESESAILAPFSYIPLTPKHRQLHLQWCQASATRNTTDWSNVLFSDESRFVLGTDDDCIWVWRHIGKFHLHCYTTHCLHSRHNGLGGRGL